MIIFLPVVAVRNLYPDGSPCRRVKEGWTIFFFPRFFCQSYFNACSTSISLKWSFQILIASIICVQVLHCSTCFLTFTKPKSPFQPRLNLHWMKIFKSSLQELCFWRLTLNCSSRVCIRFLILASFVLLAVTATKSNLIRDCNILCEKKKAMQIVSTRSINWPHSCKWIPL